jgi:hypothetical protein
MMKRGWFVGVAAAAVSVLALAGPVLAHGDHDARPLARGIEAGPYIISLWQVYPDAGAAMTPHLIVMVDGNAAAAGAPGIAVQVNATPLEVRPSTTTADGWETTTGITEGDVVSVTISDGDQSWDLESVVVPPPPTSMIPMPELIYTSIFLTAGTAVWAARRTGRTWRRPVVALG